MSEKRYYRLLFVIILVGVITTALLIGYTVYAHETCSILGFLAGER